MNFKRVDINKIRGKPLAVAGVAIVLIAVVAFAVTRPIGSELTRGADPVFRVRQGPLTISVVESGTIKSLEQVSLKCEVEGNTTLIYLIPEGTRVKKGDLLVELDASSLQDRLIQQQISVENAEAAFVRARENLAVAKNQAHSDISRAELDYEFAQEDVKQYEEGEYPLQVKEAESNITLAREELERAAEKLKWSERLFEEKYISHIELEADSLTHQRAQLNYELAVAKLQLLEEYTSKRKLAELKSDVDQAEMALERVKLQANADVVQAAADLKAKEMELRQQRSKLEKYEGQLAKTKIYAPRDGLVVYATSVQGGGRHRREPLEEGQGVRERQELIYLPSAESMMAQIQIHESSLEKVRIGLPVRVTVDALSGQTFIGRVAKISPLPDAQSAWLNPDLKVYPTEIHLEDIHPELRTGMSCQAEIIVEQHANALYIPVQAVLRLANKPTVFVREGGQWQPHPIEIGLDNNSMVHVLAGLEPGQQVLLAPPLEAKAEAEEEQKTDTDTEPAPVESTIEAPPVPVQDVAPTTQPRRDRKGRRDEQTPSDDESRREERRRRFQNMTPEEREAEMRKRSENLSPEEREKMMERMRQRRGRDHGDGEDGAGS